MKSWRHSRNAKAQGIITLRMTDADIHLLSSALSCDMITREGWISLPPDANFTEQKITETRERIEKAKALQTELIKALYA